MVMVSNRVRIRVKDGFDFEFRVFFSQSELFPPCNITCVNSRGPL